MPQNRIITNLPWLLVNDELGGEIAAGGILLQAKAAAALNIGDCVFVSAAGTVNKSTTAGDHTEVCGIVVGGRNFERHAIQRTADVGKAAAATGGEVFVCISGLCYGVAQAGIAVGVSIKPDVTTAGRVLTGTVSTDHGKMVGKAWQNATTAGDKILVLVSLH